MEKAYLTLTKSNGKGKKVANTAAQRKAQLEHDAWLKKQGLHKEQLDKRKKNMKPVNRIPDYKEGRSTIELSNNLHVRGGFRNGVMDNLHKETPEVQKAIMAKAARTAPAYSKGGYQYISPGTDLTDIGKKK
jgi:hypothetical protein